MNISMAQTGTASLTCDCIRTCENFLFPATKTVKPATVFLHNPLSCINYIIIKNTKYNGMISCPPHKGLGLAK